MNKQMSNAEMFREQNLPTPLDVIGRVINWFCAKKEYLFKWKGLLNSCAYMPMKSLVDFDKFLETHSQQECIYFLEYRGMCVYVGKSKCCKTRIRQHVNKGEIVFSGVVVIPNTEPMSLDALESKYINSLSPICNKQKKRNTSCDCWHFC